MDPGYFKGQWSIPESMDEEKILIQISDKNLKYIDFATFLEDNQLKRKAITYEKLISDQYISFIKFNLLEVYKNNLEKENSDYRFVIKEYREGLLLFNLMQDKIWTVRDSDSLKLHNFYNENKNKYTSFEEDRGKVIGDFQQFQEELWINSLKSKHKLILNKSAIRRLKKNYN
jgi:peptidyl-prolyl cis-trans isomerase SurA